MEGSASRHAGAPATTTSNLKFTDLLPLNHPCAPGALAATKSLMAQARLREPQDLVQPAAAIFSQAAQGPEGLEGMTAFIQKRKPQWAMP